MLLGRAGTVLFRLDWPPSQIFFKVLSPGGWVGPDRAPPSPSREFARPGAESQKSSALSKMGVTAGWTIAVVCALVLAVLLFGAWGTAGGSSVQILALRQSSGGE